MCTHLYVDVLSFYLTLYTVVFNLKKISPLYSIFYNLVTNNTDRLARSWAAGIGSSESQHSFQGVLLFNCIYMYNPWGKFLIYSRLSQNKLILDSGNLSYLTNKLPYFTPTDGSPPGTCFLINFSHFYHLKKNHLHNFPKVKR